MKPALLLFAGLLFSVCSHAQAVATKSAPVNADSLKVSMNRDTMTVLYKNQPVAVHNAKELEGFLKKIPDQQHLEIYFETVDTKPETSNGVNDILRKCNCHIVRNSITHRE